MNTFRKEERLCSRKFIDQLYKNGSSFLLYPYRVTFLFVDTHHLSPAQALLNTSKKRYKRAVDRNIIKRRLKEAYRLMKQDALYSLLNDRPELLLLSIQYVGKEIYDYAFFQKKMAAVFKRLSSSVNISKTDD